MRIYVIKLPGFLGKLVRKLRREDSNKKRAGMHVFYIPARIKEPFLPSLIGCTLCIP